VELLRVQSELVPLLQQTSDLVSQLSQLARLLLRAFCQILYLARHFVTQSLIGANIFYRVVQNGELLLQELHAMVSNLLLHVQVEVRIA